MKKLIALLLILSFIFSICACSKKGGKDPEKEDTDTTETPDDEQIKDNTIPIVVPPYKDYGRGSVDFDKVVYSRPDIQGILNAFAQVTETVKADEKAVEAQIADIMALEPYLDAVATMYSLSEIYRNKDSSSAFWQGEYAYISSNYPSVSQAIEDLLVACARSRHRTAFEEDYFRYSLEEYVDGGIYTDEVVKLMEYEANLEAEYTSLSTATVRIVYDSAVTDIHWEGTVDEVIAMAAERFAGNKESFDRVLIAINLLYEAELQKLEKPIFIELIKVRRLIADELGYSSYSELAYDGMEYDYSPEDMFTLLKDIGKYASPVADSLESTLFASYFQTTVQPTVDPAIVINTLYNTYTKLGGDYSDAYSYMLQHGLYDIAKASDNRFPGAFTTYIGTNASPYLFVTASGFIRDYTTVAHEFGHFLDGYVNLGEDGSLAVSEISSQALELLTVLRLKNELTPKVYQYLEYYTMFSMLNSALLTQSFYAAFEHLAYELDYDEITEANLKLAVEQAFKLVYGENMSINGDLSYVTLTHTVLYPFYVESYVTSGLVSLDIFFAEITKTGSAGAGFAIYESFIKREDANLNFLELLENVGLDSPFSEGKVKEIANNMHFYLKGGYCYAQAEEELNAA